MRHIDDIQLLPGDFQRRDVPSVPRGKRTKKTTRPFPGRLSLPAWWYEYRLGLIDKACKPRADAGLLQAAITFYVNTFLDAASKRPMKNEGPWAAFYWYCQETAEWDWTAPLRPGTRVSQLTNRSFEAYGTRLVNRHALANFWRSRVFNLLGKNGVALHPDVLMDTERMATDRVRMGPVMAFADKLAHALSLPSCPQLLRDTVLGPGYRGTRPLEVDLVLPEKERWWWTARSMERLRYLVIDMDCKKPEHRPKFEASMRMLLGPDMPKPALITTSRSGNGRHVWYFTTKRSGLPYSDQIHDLRYYAEPFEQRLCKMGFDVRPGSVEVFPRTPSAKRPMPAMPFGIRSFLCGDDGLVIVERDPLKALVRWYEQLGCPDSVPRITKADIVTASTSATKHDRELAQPSREADLPDDEDVHQPRILGKKPPSRRQILVAQGGALGDSEFERDKGIYDDGGRGGSTNKDIPRIARYLRYRPEAPSRPVPDQPVADDEANLQNWLPFQREDRKPTSFKQYLAQFRRAFKDAFPYRSRLGTPSLLPSDLHRAEELTLRLAMGDARRRAGFFRVSCFVLGMARSHADDVDPKGVVRVGLWSAMMQAVWHKGYREVIEALRDDRVVRRFRRAVDANPKMGRAGVATIYAINLSTAAPGDGVAVLVPSPAALIPIMEKHLGAARIEALFPRSKDWRRLFGS